jgi:branched-chain amino acid transport system permease protein
MRTLASNLYLLIAAYGLALPVSYAGLPVLGQGAFVAVGAFGTLLLAAHGTPLLVAVLTAVVVAAVAGYLAGFAAARLAGASLALATWGLAWLAYVVLVEFRAVSGGSQGLTHTTPARLVSPSLGVVVTLHPWVHCVAAGLIAVSLAAVLWRSASGPWGLDWAALRTGPSLAESLGVPVQRRRRALLSASAALGALGGAGTALLLGVIAPTDFSPLLSLQLFVAVLVGGVATWWGPAIGVALLAALPSTSDNIASAVNIDPLRARAVLTAVLLVGALTLRRPVAAWLSGLVSRPTGRRVVGGSVTDVDPAAAATAPRGDVVPLLRVDGVAVTFGAVRALDGVDLDLRAGEVHALIGPNGSGKSTALRVIAGVIPPDSGAVTIGLVPAAQTGGTAARVRAGVVRTLQRTATLGALPAGLQVAVGARSQEVAPFLGLRHLLATPAAAKVAAERSRVTTAALALVGLGDRAGSPAERLDSAEQRLLQIARAAATGAAALLLDEPAAGMSRPQRDGLETVLRRLAAAGHGVVVVEHDMGLVGRVADRVTVLAEGRVIATGTPAEVRRDPAVRHAYLGDVDGVVAKGRANA